MAFYRCGLGWEAFLQRVDTGFAEAVKFVVFPADRRVAHSPSRGMLAGSRPASIKPFDSRGTVFITLRLQQTEGIHGEKTILRFYLAGEHIEHCGRVLHDDQRKDYKTAPREPILF